MSAAIVSSDHAGVTIVTQTRVRPEKTDEFGRLQGEMAHSAEAFTGFVEQSVIPPNLPSQTDWVTMQWFANKENASAWLRSTTRHEFTEQLSPLTTSQPNTYLVNDIAGASKSTATAVIATRVKDGCDDAYRAWQHRVAAVCSAAPGYEGHRFEAPIAGVQEKWLTVLWFDTDDNLQAWLTSPERASTMSEVAPLTDTISARSVRTGFDQWFDSPSDETPPAPWKMSMLVLVVLYPCVFVIDTFLVPILTDRGVPFWLTLFGANTLTVAVLGVTVPFVSRRFTWWLTGRSSASTARKTLQGVAAVVGIYLVSLTATASYSLLS
jgi:antibiotic biosynthesis monooxygenase (ABM) superfamily enzyme